MPGIFGLVHRDGRPVQPEVLDAMARRMHRAGAGHRLICDSRLCGLGESGGSPETQTSDGDRWRLPRHLAIAVSARLDARQELYDALEMSSADCGNATDAELVRRAYVRWGDTAPTHLIGDWAFAAWNRTEQRLFLARDPQGVGTLYTFVDDRLVAFASTLDALLAVPGVSTRLDELYLALVLTGWPPPDTTCYADISRLPVGCSLSVTTTAVERRQYCDLTEVQPLRLASDGEYVEACRELLTRAVSDRLRTSRSAAVALSGGLDSGAVAVTASQLLGGSARPLAAISHVPLFSDVELEGQTANEAPYIAATAVAAGVAPVTYLNSARVTPVAGLHQALSILGSPTPAAANQYWLLDLLATTYEQGHDTLLTGQLGNFTISWGGMPEAMPWRTLWRAHHRRAAMLALLPRPWRTRVRRWRRQSSRVGDGCGSIIRPDLERRLANRLADASGDALSEPQGETAVGTRIRKLRSSKGEFVEIAIALGVTVCDPTADLRLVKFCLSLPDAQFVSPTGQPRWLARRLLTGRLPPEVVWNRRRGRQAADLPLRLAACVGEVETALAECGASPIAAEYIDLTSLRQIWQAIGQHPDAASHRHSAAVLARGLMVGLFLARRR